jgi:hypothetical protein
MAETFINLTEGSGKKAHAWDRTIGANTVLDEFTVPGEYPLASYAAIAAGVSAAVAADHVLQLMAGSSLNVRIRRIHFEQRANATTATVSAIQIWRLTTAGTGGTVITPTKHDNADAASGATAMTLPTAKGTEATLLYEFTTAWRQAVSATGSAADDAAIDWSQHPGQKPIIIPAGTANGIVIKTVSAIAAATVDAYIDFVETSFV